MARYYRIKTIFMVLAISSLLILLSSCNEKGTAEKIGEKIDNTVESITEELGEAAKNTSKELDKAVKVASEKLDEAAKKTSKRVEEASDNVFTAVEAAKETSEKIEEVSNKIRNAVKKDEWNLTNSVKFSNYINAMAVIFSKIET